MGTVSKALSLLNYFTLSRQEIGLADLARLSGQNKATVYRHMAELLEHGIVEQVGSDRQYRLGPALIKLSSLREAAAPTREVSKKILQLLNEKTCETSHLSMVAGTQLNVTAYSYSSRHGTRVTMEDAEVISFHSTSSGLAVLAYSEAHFQDKILSRPLEKRTPFTITDPNKIRDMLDRIRDQGFAESVSGFEEDVHSIACPVFNAGRDCIGAIAVAAPVARMDTELKNTTKDVLFRASLEMTQLMGGFPAHDYEALTEKILATASLI